MSELRTVDEFLKRLEDRIKMSNRVKEETFSDRLQRSITDEVLAYIKDNLDNIDYDIYKKHFNNGLGCGFKAVRSYKIKDEFECRKDSVRSPISHSNILDDVYKNEIYDYIDKYYKEYK